VVERTVRDWQEARVGHNNLPDSGTLVNYMAAPLGAQAYTSQSLGI
jgi:hypothetical protein